MELRALLRDFSLDAANFYTRYGVTPIVALSAIEGNLTKSVDGSEFPDAKSIAAAALLFGTGIDLSSRFASTGERADQDAIDELNGLIRDHPQVICTIRDLYGLGEDLPTEIPTVHAADWSTLQLHRVGTTSLIFRASSQLESQDFVIKLVHLYFQELVPIAQATQSYKARSEALRNQCRSLAKVYASGDGWVIEELIEGLTLFELGEALKKWEREGNKVGYRERITLFENVFVPLIEAVGSLHRASEGLPHADLSPSNILIATPAGTSAASVIRDLLNTQQSAHIKLIDIGRNLLASTTIGRVTSPEASFVAPEVQQLSPDESPQFLTADLFSLGLLLPCCLGFSDQGQLGRGQVPERLFSFDPILARLALDLADRRPDFRMHVCEKELGVQSGDLTSLATVLHEICGALREIDQREPSTFSYLAWTVVPSIRPLSSALRTLRISRQLRHGARIDEPKLLLGPEAVWLSLWRVGIYSFLFLACLAFFVSVISDYSVGAWAVSIQNGLKTALRGMGYQPGDHEWNWEGRIIGLTYTMAALHYYIAGFSRVSFRMIPGRLRVVTETVNRVFYFLAISMILLAIVVRPHEWMLWSALGLIGIAANNYFSVERQASVNRFIAEAERGIPRYIRLTKGLDHLETSDGRLEVLRTSETLESWRPSMIIYVLLSGALAAWNSVAPIRDHFLFAMMIASVNVFFFTYAQALRNGEKVHTSLAISALYGERYALQMAAASDDVNAGRATKSHRRLSRLSDPTPQGFE